MKPTLLFLFFMSFLFNISCNAFNPIDSKINDFVTQIEGSKENMTENDWKEADLTIEKLKKELDEQKQDLTPEQISNANKAIGRYAGLRIKDGLFDLKDQLKDFGEQLEGAVKELTDTLDN